MKKTFLWYYSVIWLIIGTLVNLYDFLGYFDGASFWAVALATPTIVWLIVEGGK